MSINFKYKPDGETIKTFMKASKLILHGHTIVDQVTHYGNRINIDTGAAWGDKLSAVVTIGEDVWKLTETGRVKITQTF